MNDTRKHPRSLLVMVLASALLLVLGLLAAPVRALAEVTVTSQEELMHALEAREGEIRIGEGFALSTPIPVTHDVRIYAQDAATLSCSSSMFMFSVSEGASLTLSGPLTLDGGEKARFVEVTTWQLPIHTVNTWSAPGSRSASSEGARHAGSWTAWWIRPS